MRISVFTPTNNVAFLMESYRSLVEQTISEWEWILVVNGGVEIPREIREDERVLICNVLGDISLDRIGALKRIACEQVRGGYGRAEDHILVELDHDDLLVPEALAKLRKAFADDSEVGFVYSNCCRIDGAEGWPATPFTPANGWKTRSVMVATDRVGPRELLETVSPEPVPQNLGSILFAPDHVRAWHSSAYWDTGGHDQSLAVGDDHDLICRTYLNTKMLHLDEPLYVYRIHGGNNWLANQERISAQSDANWNRYKYAMAERWAKDNKLEVIDLERAGVNHGLRFQDNSVGLVTGCLASVMDPIAAMNEIYRVLAHGGFLLSMTPSTDGKGAWCDPTARSYWNELSFRYYAGPRFRAFLEPRCNAKFMARQVKTVEQDGLPYVSADLIAVKDGPRFHGPCEW